MFDFSLQQFWLDGRDDAYGYFVLQCEDVAEVTLVSICPEMCSGCCIDQLAGNTDCFGRLADAAFQHIANAKLAPDLFEIDGSAPIGEARISRDNEQ